MIRIAVVRADPALDLDRPARARSPAIRRRPSQTRVIDAGAVEELGLQGRHAAARAQGDGRAGVPRSSTRSRSGASAIRSQRRPCGARLCAARVRAWSSALAQLLMRAAQLALLAHGLQRSLRPVGSPGSGRCARRASAGSTSGSGSPTGIAWAPRCTTTAAQRVLPRLARRRARRPGGRAASRAAASAAPLMPTIREGWIAWRAVGRCDLHLADQLGAPRGPRARWRCRPCWATSAAIWGRTSLQRSPLRGAAKARSSSAPVLAGEHHRLHLAGLPRRPGAGARVPSAGAIRSEPRSTRLDARRRRGRRTSQGPSRRRRPRRRPRLVGRASSSASGSTGSDWPCGGTSRASPPATARRQGRTGAESSGRTVSPVAPRPSRAGRSTSAKTRPLEALDDQLGDPVAAAQLDRLRAGRG